jgi:hypothetical protein
MGEKENAYTVLVGKTMNETTEIYRHRWEDNIEMDFK